jgi:hypothetical protein
MTMQDLNRKRTTCYSLSLSLSLSLKTSVQNITCEFQFIDCIGRHLERWWQASKLCEEHLKSREEIGVSPDSKQNI